MRRATPFLATRRLLPVDLLRAVAAGYSTNNGDESRNANYPTWEPMTPTEPRKP